MTSSSYTGMGTAPRSRIAQLSADLARRCLFSLLGELRHGQLVIRDRGRLHRFGTDIPGELSAEIEILDSAAYPELLLRGSVGVGESYARGLWASDDVVALIRLMVRNADWLERYRGGWTRLASPLLKLSHTMRRNTRNGSRRNIAAHYDLSNEFFQTFLDESLTYSAGIFTRRDASLREASEEKLDRICRELRLGPDDHVLEIGTGWGSFALHAASRYGCKVTTTTISRQQYELARQRIETAGLEHQIEVLLEDYRDLEGWYDKLVSIEMIEAVGHEFYDTYFERCSRLLKPNGAMLLQAITIRDDLYDQARTTVDFIKHCIFPGGHLPSRAEIQASLGRSSDLSVHDVFDLTDGYAETLRHWRERFVDNVHQVRRLGFDENFRRMWEFYLSYCEGGFRERRIQDVQMLLAKPHWPGAAGVVNS